ncbi:MAG: pyridoxamine 5'-phosphate oxidase family protein [Bacillota bacterium]|nr:pyridoxamine 5'-phosphate oxidase family protein [Bacillota bacterium]
MFREMRLSKQLLPREKSIDILKKRTAGVLAVSGDDDYPYTVPLSYVYDEEKDKIYFHCAKKGHKLDGIARNPKVSFCIIDKDQIVPEEYTTYFRSVVVFGKARILDDPTEKRAALELLAAKYSPDHEEGRKKEIEGSFNAVCMVEIAIDHMSGKEAIELVKGK